MVNKPKKIGTWCETQIVNLAHISGFPGADRRPLRGASEDTGDILLCPGIIGQSKSAKVPPSGEQIATWMLAVDEQRKAARADMAFLTVRRYHVNVRVWPTYFWVHDILDMYSDTNRYSGYRPTGIITSMTLSSAFLMLRYAGWGTEPEE